MLLLISTLSVIRHLICDNNLNWFLNLNLIYEKIKTGGKRWPVDFNAGKTQLVSFDWSNNNSFIDMKKDVS